MGEEGHMRRSTLHYLLLCPYLGMKAGGQIFGWIREMIWCLWHYHLGREYANVTTWNWWYSRCIRTARVVVGIKADTSNSSTCVWPYNKTTLNTEHLVYFSPVIVTMFLAAKYTSLGIVATGTQCAADWFKVLQQGRTDIESGRGRGILCRQDVVRRSHGALC